jgi:hypothetical protein
MDRVPLLGLAPSYGRPELVAGEGGKSYPLSGHGQEDK